MYVLYHLKDTSTSKAALVPYVIILNVQDYKISVDGMIDLTQNTVKSNSTRTWRNILCWNKQCFRVQKHRKW